jgi:hypothetical protein
MLPQRQQSLSLSLCPRQHLPCDSPRLLSFNRRRHRPFQRRPRKSPLHSRYPAGFRIRLSQNLGNALERTIALTIASHLSAQSGQHVGLLDLVGLSLYVWSDCPLHDASALAQSIQSDRPFQGLLLRERSPQPERDGGLWAGAVRLELAVV